MALIDLAIPDFQVRSLYGIDVATSAQNVWATFRTLDLGTPVTRLLFTMRGLMLAELRVLKDPLTIDTFLEHGFLLLEEDPGRELTLGLISGSKALGKTASSEDFAALDEPGLIKVVWSWSVSESGPRTRLETETRVQCTDEATLRKFRLYWALVGPFSGLIRRSMLRRIARASQAEV